SREVPAQDGEFPHLYAQSARLLKGEGVSYDAAFPTGNPKPNDTAVKIAYLNPLPGALDDFGIHGYATYEMAFCTYAYQIRTDQATIKLAGASTPELERYVERSRKYSISSVPIVKGVLRYVEGADGPRVVDGKAVNGNTVPENANYLLMPREELVYTWHEVP